MVARTANLFKRNFSRVGVIALTLLFFGAVYQAFALNYIEPGLTLDPGIDYPGTCVDPLADCTTQILRIGNPVGDGTPGSLFFVDEDGNLAEDNDNLFWDADNVRLGIGTDAPAYRLDIAGDTSPTFSSILYSDTGGANDLVPSGAYTGDVGATFNISISAAEAFSWTKNGVSGGTNVPITGSAQLLSDGIFITFTGGATGHTLGTVWRFKAFGNVTGNINTTAGLFQNGDSVAFQDADANNLLIGKNAGGAVTDQLNSLFGGGLLTNTFNTFVGIESGNDINGGYRNTFLGYNAGDGLTSGGANTFLGYNATNSSAIASSSIALGYKATATGSNQFVVGASNDTTGLITNAYMGAGVTSNIASTFTLNATGGSGTNRNGYDFTIAGGKSTGSANGGSLIFSTSSPGASGSTLNSLSQRMSIDTNGLVTIGSGTQFQVNSSGNFVKINNVATSWPSSQGGGGTFLSNNGAGVLSWTTPPTGISIGDTVGSATEGSIFFAGLDGALNQDNANFFWDNSNNRLGIGTTTPGYRLDVMSPTSSTIDPAIFGGGDGRDDMTSGGTYVGATTNTFVVVIDGLGSPDTFSWSDLNNEYAGGVAVPITGSEQALDGGVTVTFNADTGHDGTETWTIDVDPAGNEGDINIGGGLYFQNTLFLHNSGTENSFFGAGAGNLTMSGLGGNVGIGTSVLSGGTTANRNTAVGTFSGVNITGGAYNTLLGYNAGGGVVNATNNIMIGANTGGSVISASNNILIGTSVDNAADTSDFLSIGDTVYGNLSTKFVGINDATPDYRLDVETDAASYVASFFNDGNATNRLGLLISSGQDSGDGTLIQFNDGNGTDVGEITFSGTTTTYGTSSDRRMKDNIVDTRYGLDDVLDIQVHDFTFKGEDTGRVYTGFIAQELYDIYPDAVFAPDDGRMWSVDYGKITPIIVKGIQELDVKVEDISSLDLAREHSLANRLVAWFADTANGIQNIFAKRVTVEELCFDDVCLTKDDVINLLNDASAGGDGGNTDGGANDGETPENTDVPPPAEDVENPVNDPAPEPPPEETEEENAPDEPVAPEEAPTESTEDGEAL